MPERPLSERLLGQYPNYPRRNRVRSRTVIWHMNLYGEGARHVLPGAGVRGGTSWFAAGGRVGRRPGRWQVDVVHGRSGPAEKDAAGGCIVDTISFGLVFLELVFGQLDRLPGPGEEVFRDRKSTRLNSSHSSISYAVFCLKKK